MKTEVIQDTSHDSQPRKHRNIVVRWLKFNAVGAVGIGVQLAVLLALKSRFHLSYLLATALAVEAAVLHNFLWHERYTWADRVRPSWRVSLPRLLRFNLTTGAVSIAGNLLLMKAMVDLGHLNYLIANGIAIMVCSLLNFLVSERWVFPLGSRMTCKARRAHGRRHLAVPKQTGTTGILLVVSVLACHEGSGQVQSPKNLTEERTAALAIKGCGAVDGNTAIVVAVYLSSWDAWKQA